MNITNIIKETIENKHNVWICSDLHILKREKTTPRIICNRSTYMKFLDEMDKVHPGDCVIFLGDLMDDTIPDKRVEKFIKNDFFPRNDISKIWVRGNNDMLSDAELEKHGWQPCYAATMTWDNKIITFSHTSIDVSGYSKIDVSGYSNFIYNVHGHMHRNDNSDMLYYHNPERCVNVAQHMCAEGEVINLDDVFEFIDEKVWEDYMSVDEPTEEKPGMSKFIKNQATQIIDCDIINICLVINICLGGEIDV